MGKNDAMKQARSAAGLSQQELADRRGYPGRPSTPSKRGDYNPAIRLCIGICQVLGLTLNDRFWDETEIFEKKKK